jgi:hypothetical protein
VNELVFIVEEALSEAAREGVLSPRRGRPDVPNRVAYSGLIPDTVIPLIQLRARSTPP